MSFHKEDGVSSLCQKALHIVTELCFAGQVEWEKCSGIFPPDRGSQGGGSTGNPRRAPLASSRPPGPRALPSQPRRLAPPERHWGHLWDAAPSYLAPFPTHQPATLSAGCPGFVSSPPIRLLPLLWSAPCPPAASGALAPWLPRPLAALSHASRLPTRVERRARAAAPVPLAQRYPPGQLSYGTRAAPAHPGGHGSRAWGRGRASQPVLGRKEPPYKWGCGGLQRQQRSRKG